MFLKSLILMNFINYNQFFNKKILLIELLNQKKAI